MIDQVFFQKLYFSHRMRRLNSKGYFSLYPRVKFKLVSPAIVSSVS